MKARLGCLKLELRTLNIEILYLSIVHWTFVKYEFYEKWQGGYMYVTSFSSISYYSNSEIDLKNRFNSCLNFKLSLGKSLVWETT